MNYYTTFGLYKIIVRLYVESQPNAIMGPTTTAQPNIQLPEQLTVRVELVQHCNGNAAITSASKGGYVITTDLVESGRWQRGKVIIKRPHKRSLKPKTQQALPIISSSFLFFIFYLYYIFRPPFIYFHFSIIISKQ